MTDYASYLDPFVLPSKRGPGRPPLVTPSDSLAIDVELHPAQVEIYKAMRNPKIREVVVRKGRRFGGTFVTALTCTEFAIHNPTSPGMPGKPTEIAFFGPIYENALKLFREIVDSFGATLAGKPNSSELRLTWAGGARGKCYSGENAGAVLGAGFDIVVIDETSNFPEHLVRSFIAPTLADRSGRLFLVSSPRHGRLNHFAQRALKAEAGDVPGVRGFHFTSFDNPRISREWLEAQKADTDELTWREEYLAEILDTSAQWLDPSKLRYVKTEHIPGNVYTSLQTDFAWGDPEAGMVDKVTRRRKDASVMTLLSQDALGNVYLRKEGVYEKFLTPDQAFDFAGQVLRPYAVQRYCIEREVNVQAKTKDLIGKLWDMYREKHRLPSVGMVRPVRRAHWRSSQIRMWSVLLDRGKFFVEEGSVLDGPLRDEMARYSEAASAQDKCHDDVLVAVSDVLQPGIWQGKLEVENLLGEREGGHVHKHDLYNLRNAWDALEDGGDQNDAPISRYSIV